VKVKEGYMSEKIFRDELFEFDMEIDDKKVVTQDISIDTDIFNIYFRQINDYSLMDPNTEVRLFKKLSDYKKKLKKIELIAENIEDPIDEKKTQQEIRKINMIIDSLKSEIVTANLRLVVSISKKYKNKNISLIDLINEGNIGLMEAVDKFDYKRGTKFSTYAIYWIKQAIMKALSDKSRVIRIPLYLNNLLKKINDFIMDYQKMNGCEPAIEIISEKFDIPRKKLIKILKVNSEINFFNEPVSFESNFIVEDFIFEENTDIMEKNFITETEFKTILDKALSTLTNREKLILKLRYGLNTGKAYTLEETGKVLGLTRERIRQIQKKAIEKLRNSSYSKFLMEIFEDLN